MSTVISIRIPKKLKDKMDKFNEINWSELIRKFIEEKIAQLEPEETLKGIEEHLKEVSELPRGTVARWIRSYPETH
ncbi:MAG: CopG family transcriptional regulator [Thermoprotei archaeon]|mgnify:CR=1 FL=1|nr:MAG: CopG family transcriptional regulator [Thermoprotei archaeon]